MVVVIREMYISVRQRTTILAECGEGRPATAAPSRARSRLSRVVDAIFGERRLADIYDPLDADRSDLDVYADLVDELGARTVLDVGCGTGTFACMLARRGKEVIGVDPAVASVDVARRKAGADRAAPGLRRAPRAGCGSPARASPRGSSAAR
jgi:2-polyprenyl-3-methyl-5-hydroxy-6-metoxy-1,4-benzoquinol methylase